MRRKLFLFLMFSAFFFAKAQEITDFKQWVIDLDWKTPKRSGVQSVDDMYEQSAKLYKSIKAMADSVPMYSLRSIVDNGDTLAILVVDQDNRPYDSFSAAEQYLTGLDHLVKVMNNATNLTGKYGTLLKDLPDIVKSKGLGGIKIVSDATKVSKKVGKIGMEFLPQMKKMYEKRGNPIKAYSKAQASLKSGDGFLNTGFDHVPEFGPGEDPSNEELDILLEKERSHRLD